jgi:hypothetical protein
VAILAYGGNRFGTLPGLQLQGARLLSPKDYALAGERLFEESRTGDVSYGKMMLGMVCSPLLAFFELAKHQAHSSRPHKAFRSIAESRTSTMGCFT